MTEPVQKITVFAANGPDSDAISAVVCTLDNVKLNRRDMTLSKANGTAHALAASGEMILFRTSGESEQDEVAVRELCRNAGPDVRVVAISDPDLQLAAARKLLQAGVADVLPMPVTKKDLTECLERLRAPVAAVAPLALQRGKIITVAQARGGIGGTTVAVNLADALRGEAGLLRRNVVKKVALVDLDLQFGGIASFLDIEANDSLCRMAKDEIIPDATFLSQAMVATKGGLSVITAPTEFVPMESLTSEQVEALLEQLTLQFDYVVVDLPRTLVQWVQSVLNMSDRLYLITDSSVPAIRQSKRLIDAYSEESPRLPIDIIVNFEAKPIFKGRHHVQAAKLLERELRHWLPLDPKATREALDRGVPLSVAASRSALTKAIKKLAVEVIDEKTTAKTDPMKREATQGSDAIFKSIQSS
ncbi:CpaE family protein [Falsihalocynthiibacter sp. S25ZX9]|uniref:AAA family ATPase n=1 Tax=Falsihalocynthiibacter sp. S25ZX9 TaxID=3240870 RepID=UPI0035100B14